ncbi:MAG: Hca operon transcriptional activator HcaR [Chroococcidiopsis cubana SAG 39.79]|uniref:LysR family transcriptional regulator n=1 Tax=Chroococcidiopsis cubana SAG 39.79 TaxID=388085 RepID=A0AB37UAU0_9CYAN|nr:LysR family transcriptional regulator [Chroococcidiopsis cubana]MDZ4877157.1 Hca operon transcriptional activator HcaR [Chroococcidiopsis cubana SAG 39.79]RUT03679.1 LysR family transcriptional regulator [Chroococcidiopsis cubana SAG 39.79]
MELRQLQYFLAVAEELNFGRAAARLGIAQPPLSRQIRQLEQELGVELFRRTKRRVELTEAGIAFVEEVRQILAQVEQGVLVAQRASRGEIGRLVVGFEGSSTYDVIPMSLKVYRERFPEVDLAVYAMTTEEQIQALLEGRIGIGFVVSPINDKRLAIETILRESLILAIPENHPLATRTSVRARELESEPFITFQRDRGCGLYDQVIAVCQRANFSPRIIQEADEMQVILGFVAAGLGVTLLSASVVQFQRPGVVYRMLQPSTPKVSLALAWRRDLTSAALQAFIEVVRECAR